MWRGLLTCPFSASTRKTLLLPPLPTTSSRRYSTPFSDTRVLPLSSDENDSRSDDDDAASPLLPVGLDLLLVLVVGSIPSSWCWWCLDRSVGGGRPRSLVAAEEVSDRSSSRGAGWWGGAAALGHVLSRAAATEVEWGCAGSAWAEEPVGGREGGRLPKEPRLLPGSAASEDC